MIKRILDLEVINLSFVHTTIMVKNMEESLKFYQEIVGLTRSHRFPTDTDEIIFLGDGETKVELIYNKNIQDIHYSEHISLGFSVSSLEETMEFLKQKKITIQDGPIRPNPAVQFIYILDPNGLKVQFIETSR